MWWMAAMFFFAIPYISKSLTGSEVVEVFPIDVCVYMSTWESFDTSKSGQGGGFSRHKENERKGPVTVTKPALDTRYVVYPSREGLCSTAERALSMSQVPREFIFSLEGSPGCQL